MEKKTTTRTGRKPTSRKTTTTTTTTTRKKPEVKVLSGDVINGLEFVCPKDYILEQDVTDIELAKVVVPKGYTLLFFPNSAFNSILTVESYPEGEHTVRTRAYALTRSIERISKGMIVGSGVLMKKLF